MVSWILKSLSSIKHKQTINCYFYHTDLHVADVQRGSKQNEMEKKIIIKKESIMKKTETGRGKEKGRPHK